MGGGVGLAPNVTVCRVWGRGWDMLRWGDRSNREIEGCAGAIAVIFWMHSTAGHHTGDDGVKRKTHGADPYGSAPFFVD